MLASFLITFREALEAFLIIGIIAAYLEKIGRRDLRKYLYLGVGTATLASLVLAFVFLKVYSGLEGRSEKLFEGFASLAASVVLTYMIFWMAESSKKLKGEIQEKIDFSITRGQLLGIAILAFIVVFREGVETVLFLGTIFLIDPSGTIFGFVFGVSLVIVLAFLAFKGIYRIDLRRFFKYTSILLVLFAAGLTAYGVHELIEAQVIPPLVEPVWDLNPPVNPDGSYPPLHEKGFVGGILKSLLGYNGNPALTEVLSYLLYWLIIGGYVFRVYKKIEVEATLRPL
ncbi:MAG: FTR1 family protein [Candidatus Methanofastidiosia archaeon]